jgi:AcrR family transcriptional regulator
VAAVELFLEHGYDQTTAESIALRAGVTERTFFRHFVDKREVLFGAETDLRDTLTRAIAQAPEGTKPLPALKAAFQEVVPLIESNRAITEPGARLIATTPALLERSLAKNAALVAALAEALRERGVEPHTAALCAQIAMDTFRVAGDWSRSTSGELRELVDEAFDRLREAAADLG